MLASTMPGYGIMQVLLQHNRRRHLRLASYWQLDTIRARGSLMQVRCTN